MQMIFSLCAQFERTMKLLIIFACLLSLTLAAQLYSYTPGLGYYPTGSTGLAYARSSAILPLAYARLVSPLSQSHVYHSVETPNSFQQQYRSDYKPLTYEYIY